MVQISGENTKSFWSKHSGRVTKIYPSSPPISKDEGPKNIGHNMNIKNLIFGVNKVMIRVIWFLMTVYYKIQQMSWQNATAILLQNSTVSTKCDVCYKLRQHRSVSLKKLHFFFQLLNKKVLSNFYQDVILFEDAQITLFGFL